MLPAPEDINVDLKEKCVERQTEEEKRLAQIWCDVLHLERVGRNDDYFDLGAIRCVAFCLSRMQGKQALYSH
jgi:hypothetical protein